MREKYYSALEKMCELDSDGSVQCTMVDSSEPGKELGARYRPESCSLAEELLTLKKTFHRKISYFLRLSITCSIRQLEKCYFVSYLVTSMVMREVDGNYVAKYREEIVSVRMSSWVVEYSVKLKEYGQKLGPAVTFRTRG